VTSAPLIQRLSGRIRGLSPARSGRAYAAAGVIATGLYFVLPADGKELLFVAVGASAVAAVYLGTVRNLEQGRTAWYAFALGLSCSLAGDIVSAVYEIRFDHEPPTPSVADVFHLAGYPLIALGVFSILKQLGGRTSRAALLETAVLSGAVALVQWVAFVEPYLHGSASSTARIVDIAYPSMDVLLLVAVAQMLVGQSRSMLSYRLLIGAIALWVVADEVYALTAARYRPGDWVDACWLLSYVAWGTAALDPSMARIPFRDRRMIPRLTPPRIMLLGGAMLTGPVVLGVERVGGYRSQPGAVAVGMFVIATLLLTRFVGVVRAVERAHRDERLARRDAEDARMLIEAQNARLREVDRLKDEFVSSVSHELRTPLTSISGYVELLLADVRDEATRSHLQVVDRNASRLLGLVSDLLFAARLQSGHLELNSGPVDLRELVEQTVQSGRPHAEAGRVALRTRIEHVPLVSGEQARLAQLLDNLVSNAIKFTPEGGTIDISLAARDGYVRLDVSDTGIGITEQERAHLFERFFRTQSVLERQIPGTGLGLYISKAIVEAHGGRIAVRSGEGEGTTFVVELPIVRVD
jgi:signal transduction histidine kinase